MGIKQFFKNAFSDMKEDAKAQHEVDRANFAAAKAEAAANFKEAQAMGKRDSRKALMEKEREAKIASAESRKRAAEERIEKLK